MRYGDESISMGFVEQFVEVFKLRSKLTTISAEISEKKWSPSWPSMWGNKLYNKTVVHVNPTFEKLLKPVTEERTLKDRIKSSLFMEKSLKAINKS